MNRVSILWILILLLAGMNRVAVAAASTNVSFPGHETNEVEIQIRSVSVDGKNVDWNMASGANLGTSPQNIQFTFGPVSTVNRPAVRLRYKLEGLSSEWNENDGVMSLTVRFFDAAG